MKTVMLVVLLSAGCLAPTPLPTTPMSPPPEAPGPLVVPFGLHDCRFAVAIVELDAAQLRPHVPAGFTPTVSYTLPAAVGPTSAALGLEAFECVSEGLGDTPGSYHYGSVFTGVAPDEVFKRSDVSAYYVKWDTLVENASKRAALVGAGMPARDGASRVSFTPLSGASAVEASLELADTGSFRFQGAGQVGGPVDGFEYVEYSPTTNGSLGAWHSKSLQEPLTIRARGSAVVGGSAWWARLIGPDPVPVLIFAATWSFAPGNITVPVASGSDVR